MIWFWLGFFALVALLLVFDLGVLNRNAKEPTLRSAALATVGWVVLGLSFVAIVYPMYENNWLGAHLHGGPPDHADGAGGGTRPPVNSSGLKRPMSTTGWASRHQGSFCSTDA